MTAKLSPGDQAPDLMLPTADGGLFDGRTMIGRRWLLSFHRYAT